MKIEMKVNVEHYKWERVKQAGIEVKQDYNCLTTMKELEDYELSE